MLKFNESVSKTILHLETQKTQTAKVEEDRSPQFRESINVLTPKTSFDSSVHLGISFCPWFPSERSNIPTIQVETNFVIFIFGM